MDPAERATVEALGHGFFRILVRYGFMEEPDLPEALAAVRAGGLELAPMRTSFILGRETLIPSRHPGMALWREHLFAVMSRNARPATSFFCLPPNRVVELGAQIELLTQPAPAIPDAAAAPTGRRHFVLPAFIVVRAPRVGFSSRAHPASRGRAESCPSRSCTAPAGPLPRWRDSSPTTHRAAQGRSARRH